MHRSAPVRLYPRSSVPSFEDWTKARDPTPSRVEYIHRVWEEHPPFELVSATGRLAPELPARSLSLVRPPRRREVLPRCAGRESRTKSTASATEARMMVGFDVCFTVPPPFSILVFVA